MAEETPPAGEKAYRSAPSHPPVSKRRCGGGIERERLASHSHGVLNSSRKISESAAMERRTRRGAWSRRRAAASTSDGRRGGEKEKASGRWQSRYERGRGETRDGAGGQRGEKGEGESRWGKKGTERNGDRWEKSSKGYPDTSSSIIEVIWSHFASRIFCFNKFCL